MIKYYAKTKRKVEYVIELCACSSYLNLRRYWLDENNVPSTLWVWSYTDAKTCIEKAGIDFSKSFDNKKYRMTIECHCWKKIPVLMRNINEEELDYAK